MRLLSTEAKTSFLYKSSLIIMLIHISNVQRKLQVPWYVSTVSFVLSRFTDLPLFEQVFSTAMLTQNLETKYTEMEDRCLSLYHCWFGGEVTPAIILKLFVPIYPVTQVVKQSTFTFPSVDAGLVESDFFLYWRTGFSNVQLLTIIAHFFQTAFAFYLDQMVSKVLASENNSCTFFGHFPFEPTSGDGYIQTYIKL